MGQARRWAGRHPLWVGAAALLALSLAVAAVLLPRALPAPRGSGHPSPTASRPAAVARGTHDPARLLVPAIGVDASVEYVGVDAQGNMDVPKDPRDVAWYQPGPRPGTPGDAVIAGHYDWYDGPAVFWNLKSIQPGQTVTLVYRDGAGQRFRVSRVATYRRDQRPAYLFQPGGPALLSLITCTGPWDAAQQQYQDRLVVDASPA
jgi:Sortase domain